MSRDALSVQPPENQLVLHVDRAPGVLELGPRTLKDGMFFKFQVEIGTETKLFGEAYRKLGGLEELVQGIDQLVFNHLVKLGESALARLREYRILEYSAEDLLKRAVNEHGDAYEQLKEAVLDYLEEIAESASAKDAYRSARRQSRGRFVGFGSEGMVNAGLANAATGAAHGMFNLIGKSLTAIGNSVKKQSKFKELQRPFENIVQDFAIGIYDAMAAAFREHDIAVDSAQGLVDRRNKAVTIMENGLKAGYDRQGLFGVATQSLRFFCYDNEPAWSTLLQLCVTSENNITENLVNVGVISRFMAQQSIVSFASAALVDEKYVLVLTQLFEGALAGNSDPMATSTELDRLFHWNRSNHDALQLQTGTAFLNSLITPQQPIAENLRRLRLISPHLRLQHDLTQTEETLVDQKYRLLLEQMLAISAVSDAALPAMLQELGQLFHWNRRNHERFQMEAALHYLRSSVHNEQTIEQNLQAVKIVASVLDAQPEVSPEAVGLMNEKYVLLLDGLLAAAVSGDRPEQLERIGQLDEVFHMTRLWHEDMKRELAYRRPQYRGVLQVHGVTTLGSAFVDRAMAMYGPLGKSPFGPRFLSMYDPELNGRVQGAIRGYAAQASYERAVFLYDATPGKSGDAGFLITDKYVYGMQQFRVAVDQVTAIALTEKHDVVMINGEPCLSLSQFNQQHLARFVQFLHALFGVAVVYPQPEPVTAPATAFAMAPSIIPAAVFATVAAAAMPGVAPYYPTTDVRGTAESERVPWYHWKSVIIPLILVFFVFPFGLILLWRSPVTRLSGRVVWTLLVGLFTLAVGGVMFGIYAVFVTLALIFKKPPRPKAA